MSAALPAAVAVALQFFSSPTEVARHFETYVPSLPPCREAGAVILERQGQYFIRQISLGGAGHVEMRTPRMVGDTVAGLVHIHPDCGSTQREYDNAEMFSEDDVLAQRLWKVPSFIVVTHKYSPTMHLRVYEGHGDVTVGGYGTGAHGKLIKDTDHD